MPLYGQELSEDISPLEAGLGWAVALDKASFIGIDPIKKLKGEGVRRKTVGFKFACSNEQDRLAHITTCSWWTATSLGLSPAARCRRR